MRRIIRFGPLAIGLVILAVGLMFGLTDWAWRLGGSRSEDYPEIFFLGLVAPAGLIVSLLAGLWARSLRFRPLPPPPSSTG
jgi:hypothetical protein